jgi:SAM-dependent methyltransferase
MENWESIPVILNNRNRLASLRRMVDWLLAAGCLDIRILDNDSHYAPLLEWYRDLPPRVSLQRLNANVGPWAFWQTGLHRQLATPYIVSDADLVPAEFCPADLIARLLTVAARYPDSGKVGPGLRLESIAPAYGQGVAAHQWESRFWSRPVAPGLFSASVDTTFALYQPAADFAMRGENLRLGYPYLLDHTPWQVDEAALTGEETYYRANTAKTFSHWSSAALDPRIAASDWIQNYAERTAVLNLGCGDEYIPGWINLDVRGRRRDVEFDLETCAHARIPLEADSLDGIYASHVIERIAGAAALFDELYRVAKPGATLHLRLPHGSSNAAWDDPACVRPWFESSFLMFSQPARAATDRGYAADWQVKRTTLIVEPALLAQGADAAMNQIRTSRNLVGDMVVELTAVKPAREPRANRIAEGALFLTTDPRIAPSFSS